MWARTYVRSDLTTNARGLAVGGGTVRMLGEEQVGQSGTALAWTANPSTGAPRDIQRMIVDTLPLFPRGLIADPSAPDGSVLLSDAPTANGIAVSYLDAVNRRRIAYGLATGRTVRDTPYAIAANPSTRGVTIAGTSHDESPVAVFPTYTMIYRMPPAPAGQTVAPSITRYCEYLATGQGCSRQTCRGLAPFALAVSPSGRTLVASWASPIDGEMISTNLTILRADGTIESAQHLEVEAGARLLIPYGAVARGEDFYVAGAVQEARGGLYDAMVIRIDAGGRIAWARRFGRASAHDAAGQLQPTASGVALTGWTTANAEDVFAVEVSTAGAMLRGMRHGGAGSETGFYIEPSTAGGWFLLATTRASFGNTVNAPWGLELDSGFAIRFNATSNATSATFAPATVDVAVTPTAVCTEASIGEISYGNTSFNAAPVTLSGTIQAP